MKPPNLHTYSHQLLGFTIVSRQDAIMRFNVVLFIIISCGFELAVFIHGQHYYYPVAPPSLHCLKKHCDQIVTGKVIIHKSKGWGISKGPIISEDICGIFQLPKKYSVFLSLACWRLSFEFSRTFLESVSKSWGFQLSPRGLNSDFQWIWQMICLICWWNYQKCTHFVVIHNNTFSNFKFRIVQDRNLEYFLGDMKNNSHFLKESHL